MLQLAHTLTRLIQHNDRVMCNNKRCLIVYEFVKKLIEICSHKDMEGS